MILANAAIYVASAPKSNAVTNAIFGALDLIKKQKTGAVPPYLRDAHYKGSVELGHVGYLYPHDFPGHYVKQQYLPDEVKDQRFYYPSENGYEAKVKEHLEHLGEEEE